MSTGTVTYKQYLGDGVYADFDGYMIILETERAAGVDAICLEAPVLKALIDYATKIGMMQNGKGEVY